MAARVGRVAGDGDADGDGDVDDDDLAIFNAGYGSLAPVVSVVGVPEPGAMVLALAAIGVLMLAPRRVS